MQKYKKKLDYAKIEFEKAYSMDSNSFSIMFEYANYLNHIQEFEKANELIVCGKIDGGMIPKVRSCIAALSGGAGKAHIIDGREKHSILMEIFSADGVGTEVIKEVK